MASLTHHHDTNSQAPKPPTLASRSYSNFLLSDAADQNESNILRSVSPNDRATSDEVDYTSCQKSTHWVTVIILGQLIILATAFGFFVAVHHYGPIALPDKMATRALKSPRTVTLVVTLMATALSLASALYVCYMTPVVI